MERNFKLLIMSRVSRSVLISELDALTNGTLSTIVKNLDNHWLETFKNYGGQKIDKYPDAIKAGEVLLSDFSEGNIESVLPRLKTIWNENVERKRTSSYLIVVDGIIAKIGALKDGVKGSSFSQYLSGVSGSPSRRSCGIYTFLSTMLRNGHKIEIYHVTMDGMTNIDIPTINGIVNGQIHYSPRDIESQNLMVYKNSGDGRVPFLNFKERNATYPETFDKIYEVVNQRILKTKKYSD